MFLASMASELMGLYLTPRIAMGMRAGMMIALKMSADRMALCGVDNPITLSKPICGMASVNMAGMMAKYLATSLAMLNVVSEPRVMSICLPISTCLLYTS